MSDEERAKFVCLQARVDNLFIQKAQGAYVRSRAKWIEQEEKNLSYFFGFEWRRQEKNQINILMVNDEECSDTKVIAEEISKFYCELYSSSFSVEDSLPFLESIKNYTPQIDIIFRELSDSEIIMKELDVAVKQMSLGKAPGLTSNFYKFF